MKKIVKTVKSISSFHFILLDERTESRKSAAQKRINTVVV